jgi:CelD/BcsL family acetyltransferase involved in cellulose biosynthesis
MSDAAGIASVHGSANVRREARHYVVELIHGWDDVVSRLSDDIGHARLTPFQHPHWLGAWYDGQRSDLSNAPLVVIVRDPRQHSVLAILPLVVRTKAGLRIAEFAGGADYNAPLLGDSAAAQPIDSFRFWEAVRAALAKGGCDLVRFRKMPMMIDGLPNPLAGLPGIDACALTGHVLEPGDDYEAHRQSRERTFRKELERSWRVFTKHEGAVFERITDPARAMHVFETLEIQQGARMRGLGNDYALDDEDSSAFHRDLIRRGIGDGYVVLTALTSGDAIVATLLGIRVGSTYLMVRISNIGGIWANCSPGRLIIEKTMEALHSDGVRTFDYSVGTYDYKRRFGVADFPLRDLTSAVNWRGHAMIAAQRAVKAMQAGLAAIRRRK